MTYNGIGLRTARGSGTNGYIQRNLAHISRPKQEFIVGLKTQLNKRKVAKPSKLRVDTSIMQHNQKRQVEVLVYKRRCQYEDEGMAEADMEALLADYRRSLLQKMEQGMAIHSSNDRDTAADNEQNSHQRTAQQLHKNSVMRNALGLAENDGAIEDELELRRRQKRKERDEALTEEQRLQYEMHKLSKHPLDHAWPPAARQNQRENETEKRTTSAGQEQKSGHDDSDAKRTRHKKRSRSPSPSLSRRRHSPAKSKHKRRHRHRSVSTSVSRSRSRSRSRSSRNVNPDNDAGGGRWGDDQRLKSTSPSKPASLHKQSDNQTDNTSDVDHHKNDIVPDF